MKSIKYISLLILFIMQLPDAVAQAKKISTSCWSASYMKKGIMDTVTVTVRGKVYDQHGQPLTWYTLVMGEHTATTDEQGHYSFRQIPAGKYQLLVRGHCLASKKKMVLKPGSITEMNVFFYIEEPHLPPLGIPGKKKRGK